MLTFIAFAVIFSLIFISYVNSYEMGVEFGNHWGDLLFESWHLVMIEVFAFIFAFLYLIKKDKNCIIFLFAIIPWLIGHIGHVLNLAIADNSFIPLRWIEWPFLTIGMVFLFFGFKTLYSHEKKLVNGS